MIVARLKAYYLRGHGEKPVYLTNPDDVDSLIDQIRSESPLEAPMLVNILVVGDSSSLQTLDVGIRGDYGVMRYSGRAWFDGVVSTNEKPPGDGELPYFYMGEWTDYPTNSEIPLDLVLDAVKEYMATDGDRPTCIPWQPGLA